MSHRLNTSSLIGVLAIGTLVASATACIFDDGKYKGGGRLDTAGTAKQSSGSSSSSSGDPLGDDDDTIILDSGSTSTIDTGAQ